MQKLLGTAVIAIALATSLAAAAHSYVLGPLRIGHPWSRPTPNGAPTAAGFLTITNTGLLPDRLVGGSTPAAAKVEIHEMSMNGGIMRMREVAGGLAIAPGKTVTLAPGGYHLMLIGPTRPFKIGDHIPATLRFERAGSIKVEFYVQASAPTGEEQAPMGAMDMH